MPDEVDFQKLERLRSVFGQLKNEDEQIMLLQSEAFDRYGEEGEDIALDLLTDDPELADKHNEFWQKLEDELRK